MSDRPVAADGSPAGTPAGNTTDAIVRSLLQTDAYPGPVTEVAHVETHISHVFLTDRHAYKLKKPVRFAFLNYSTVELRLAACHDEVRLNRRLASGVYLGVMPITVSSSGQCQIGGDGKVVDYCVAMNRLPAERMLDQLIQRGMATREHIDRLVDLLVPFYAQAMRGPEIDRHATVQAIEGNSRENLTTIEQAEHGLPRAMLQRVRCSQLQYLKLDAETFSWRIRSGRVCEGHGDLRPEHVCMLEDRPIVFDCVEFSLPFRAADVISELAFLAMECDFLGAADLAKAVLGGYGSRAGDADVPERLAGFYKSYRACVRAKVELLRAAQETGSDAEHSRARARRYLQLASFYATEFYRPKLFVMVGAAGTGKSTVADALANSLALECLRTDAVRHVLTGRHEPEAKLNQGIYSESTSSRTYENLFAEAEILLREAISVVLDGTFRSRQHRERAAQLAHQHGAEVHFVYCRCPPDIARARIARRIRQGSTLSDARPELHDIQQQELDSSVDGTNLPVITVDTTEPTEASAAKVIDAVRHRTAQPA